MEKNKKWLYQILSRYINFNHKKNIKKENVIKDKKEYPEGIILTTYIVVIDTIIVMGLITLFIIKIL